MPPPSETASFETDSLGDAPTAPAPPGAQPAVPPVLADRYVLGAPLGAGGFGQVYAATDRRTDAAVAVKLLPVASLADWERLRQELIGLRFARLPGFVRLLDEGQQGSAGFIVMERVAGEAFARRGQARWAALRAPTLAVLEALARLHARGLLHLDLKPANILVDATGRPVIIDLGLAAPTDRAQARFSGTIAYAAPEQLAGRALTAAADLFAVGAILYAALAGRFPHETPAGDRAALIAARLDQPATPLARLRPDLPAAVTAVVDRLLAPAPEARFSAATAVIEALGGHLDDTHARLDRLAPRSTHADLQSLFHGPEHCLHLPSDAAAELFARTGGQADRVRRELQAWIRAGLTWFEGDRLRIEREAIERLRGGLIAETRPLARAALSPAARATWLRLRSVWPAQIPLDPTHRAALEAAGEIWPLADGRIGLQPSLADPIAPSAPPTNPLDATGRLRHLLRGLADGPDPLRLAQIERVLDEDERQLWPVVEASLARMRGAVAPEVLEMFLVVALRQDAPAALDVALRTLAALPSSDRVRRLEALIQGMRHARANEAKRARAHLTGLRPFANERLDQWRQAAWLALARGQSPAENEAVLDGMRGWAAAGPPQRRALLAGWEGNLRYRQGRYREAIALHTAAHQGKTTPIGRLASLRNRAAACLAAGDLTGAARDAQAVIDASARLRHARMELAGWRILRCAQYRSGQAGAPRGDLVDAAAKVLPFEEGLLALNEAAVAWRAREDAVALALAARSEACFAQYAYRLHAAMALMVRVLVRVAATPAERHTLAALAAHPQTPPGCAIQLWGALGPAADRAALAAHVSAWPSDRRAQRLEVLSPDEALSRGSPEPEMAKHRE